MIADNDLTLQAGNNVTIESATERYYDKSDSKTSKKGLMSSGGLGFTVGKKTENLAQTDTEHSHVGSTLGSLDGNVRIEAGKDLAIKGSDVIAKQDIDLKGQNIELSAQDATTKYHEKYDMTQSGLTVAITGTAADVYEAAKTLKNAKDANNDRLAGLQGIKGGLGLVEAYQDTQLNQSDGQPQASIGISASVGSLNVSLSQTTMDSHWASVTDQSGIFAIACEISKFVSSKIFAILISD